MTYISNTGCAAVSAPNTPNSSLRQWIALWRSRRALARLDACQLRDVGITPAQAARETVRAPWDVPQTWRN